jgi:hypothetical protein
VWLSEGRRLRLEPKDLGILLVLVEGHGHTVGKEELFEKVWPGTFVEEGNLARQYWPYDKSWARGKTGRMRPPYRQLWPGSRRSLALLAPAMPPGLALGAVL